MEESELKALKAYEIVKHEDLPDIHAEGYLLRHKKSGAVLALVPCEDENKVFNIAFRTPPTDSTGVAHIIEHTVLCGSKEFPLKDPFVELVKGSLNTFLNAMTYPDKTMYPVASTNDKDFRNLMHVYLDAVFYPNIYKEEKIFRQEGWHYELNSPDDQLKYNGVVYNEMKGVFSSPDEVLSREEMNVLFPDTPYGVESGGDPEKIPDLTYEQYLNFHRKYYHPCNSYIYLYGDMDMVDTLTFIDEHYLSHFDQIEVDSEIPKQKPFSKMKRVTSYYPVSEGEDTAKKTYLSFDAVAGDPLNMTESIAMDVLDYALLSMPGAPVRQALIDAGIGEDITGGYNDGILQPYFSITAKNADPADADRFLEVIRTTLENEVKQGIDKHSIKACLNSMEFQFREADFGQYPKGLMYGIDMMDTWLYDKNQPFVSLKQLDAYHELQKLADTDYFEKLVKRTLLDNTDSALVVLEPKPGMAEERDAKTQGKLDAYKASLSEEEVEKLVQATKDLAAYQEAPEKEENLAKLPTLKVSDIRRHVLPLSNVEEEVDGVPVVFHETETNGIVYLDLLWNMKHIPEKWLPYAGLLKSVLFNIDTDHYKYADLNNEINFVSGGITASTTGVNGKSPKDPYQLYFAIRMKALKNHVSESMDLIQEVLTSSHLSDKKRLHEILSETKAHLQMVMQQAGHSVAAERAAAYTQPADACGDLLSGIGFYQFIRDAEGNFDARADELIDGLKKVMHMIFRPESLLVSCTTTAGTESVLDGQLQKALIPVTEEPEYSEEEIEVKPLGLLNEGFTTSGQIQFVTMAGSTEDVVPYNGAMIIYRQIMGYDYLWQNIRVRGGAYGCASSFRRDGMTAFTSYRDPNLGRTKKVYEGISDYLANFTADDKTMTKYIIGTMSSVDTPRTPAMFGTSSMSIYLQKLSEKDRQKLRDEILDATQESIRALAPAVKEAVANAGFCVIGSEQAIRKEKDLFKAVEPLL